MKTFKTLFLFKTLLLVFIAVGTIVGCGGGESACDKCKAECMGLECFCAVCLSSALNPIRTAFEDGCFTFEEIAISECPALDVIEVCESYLCGGCTSDFCFDFPFPALFSGCEAIDCETIECDGAYGIKVDGSPSWTTIVDGEVVQITCE